MLKEESFIERTRLNVDFQNSDRAVTEKIIAYIIK